MSLTMPDPFTYPDPVDPTEQLARLLAGMAGFDPTFDHLEDAATLIGELAAAGIDVTWNPRGADLLEALFEPMTGRQIFTAALDQKALAAYTDHVRYLVCPNCLSDEHLRYDEDVSIDLAWA